MGYECTQGSGMSQERSNGRGGGYEAKGESSGRPVNFRKNNKALKKKTSWGEALTDCRREYCPDLRPRKEGYSARKGAEPNKYRLTGHD